MDRAQISALLAPRVSVASVADPIVTKLSAITRVVARTTRIILMYASIVTSTVVTMATSTICRKSLAFVGSLETVAGGVRKHRLHIGANPTNRWTRAGEKLG